MGIRGSKREALEILDKIKGFCDSIDLTLSETKTKLTNMNSEHILFIGTKIFRASHVNYSRLGTERRLKRNKLGIRMEAPIDRIKNKLSISSFISQGKTAPKFL